MPFYQYMKSHYHKIYEIDKMAFFIYNQGPVWRILIAESAFIEWRPRARGLFDWLYIFTSYWCMCSRTGSDT